ncbi:hypothetical protein M514_10341, partial [Trichuris suis]
LKSSQALTSKQSLRHKVPLQRQKGSYSRKPTTNNCKQMTAGKKATSTGEQCKQRDEEGKKKVKQQQPADRRILNSQICRKLLKRTKKVIRDHLELSLEK